mgnify:FL=1
MDNVTDSHKTQLSAACLLLSVAEADEILEKKELETICEILTDFFSLTHEKAANLLNEAQNTMKDATGLFEFGQHLNSAYDLTDKLDFIGCVFEVAYSDGDLHYLEHHTVKKIADILQVSREEIIQSKQEIQKYLNE